MGSSKSEKIEAEVRGEKNAGLLAWKMEEGKQVALDAKKGREIDSSLQSLEGMQVYGHLAFIIYIYMASLMAQQVPAIRET